MVEYVDVDFDGDVDVDDFIPMPGCYTGPVETDGLCECRFFDIDHDRDVDLDDLDLLLRNYAGPLEDCNDNGVLDLDDLLVGTEADCDLNGRPDACDLDDNPELDSDGDGLLDACCAPASPAAEMIAEVVSIKNRFLSFSLDNPPESPLGTGGRLRSAEPRASARADNQTPNDAPGAPSFRSKGGGPTGHATRQVSVPHPSQTAKDGAPSHPLRKDGAPSDGVFAPWSPLRFWTPPIGSMQAIRVTCVNLPSPFDAWNGTTMWVGEPSEVSENGAVVDPDDAPAHPSFTAAMLTCEPLFADWGSLGTVHVFHEAIVPGGTYEIQVINEGCGLGSEINFSQPLSLATSGWGDTVEDCSTIPCSPPDGTVSFLDITAILARFVSDPVSITKARADLEPGCPDLIINMSDVLFAVAGFQGLGYPFTPTAEDPCASTCPNPLP